MSEVGTGKCPDCGKRILERYHSCTPWEDTLDSRKFGKTFVQCCWQEGTNRCDTNILIYGKKGIAIIEAQFYCPDHAEEPVAKHVQIVKGSDE